MAVVLLTPVLRYADATVVTTALRMIHPTHLARVSIPRELCTFTALFKAQKNSEFAWTYLI